FGLVLDGLDHRPAQELGPLLGDPAADDRGVGLAVPRGEPGPAAQLLGAAEPADVADLGHDDRAEDPTDARQLADGPVAVMPGQQVRGAPASNRTSPPALIAAPNG